MAGHDDTAQAAVSRQLRFCYLDCEDAEKWAGHEELAKTILQPGASWEHFRCYCGELPPLAGLSDRFDGILISGSHYSAYEDRPWIHELAAWLRQAVYQHARVRFLGMCFGCQILAKALGGCVGKNPSGQFVLGVEHIALKPALQGSPTLQQAAKDVGAGGSACSGGTGNLGTSISEVRLIESHGDQVLELPPGGVLLAESPTAPIEMFGVAAGNVLAVQGHAELTAEDTLTKIHPAIATAGRLSAEEAEESARSLREDPTDSHLVIHLYRRFMEQGLPPQQQDQHVKQAQVGEGQQPLQQAESEQNRRDKEPKRGELARGSGVAAAGAAAASASPAAAMASSSGSATPPHAPGASAATPAGSPRAASMPPPLSPGASSRAVGAAADRLLSQLQLAVGAELDKVVNEQQLLAACNGIAAERYEQLGQAAAAARQQLRGLRQSEVDELAPHLRTLDELEAQIGDLEVLVGQMDAHSRRMQQQLAGIH